MDYTKMKVVELKELLTTRNLPSTGKKDELVARLQSADSSTDSNSTPTVAAHLAPPEDDFDFDDIEEEKGVPAATTGAGVAPPVEKKEVVQDLTNAGNAAVPAERAPVAAGSAPEHDGQKKKFTFKRIADEFAPATTTESTESTTTTATEDKPEEKSQTEAKPEDTMPAFAAGLSSTKVEDELEKRKARAARFGVPVDESTKSLERGLRFATVKDDGPTSKDTSKVVKGLDQALGEGRGRKRDHENANKGGNNNKNNNSTSRPGNDRKRSRGAPQSKPSTETTKKPAGKGILDDPAEKAKAEARAKKFGSS